MDKDMEEMLRKMLGKPSNNNSQSPGNGSVDLNNENLIKDKLSSYFLQQMLETQSKQKQQEAAASSPGPSTSQPTAQNDNMKVDLSLPDVENLVKLLLQNVKVTNQDKSALEEEKAKRRALEMEAEEMRQKIKAFELQSQPTEAAAVQKKLDAFETINFFQSGKTGDSMNSTVAKYLEDLMLKDKLAKKKLFNDPKWFPGSSKDAENSNTNSAKDKDLFKEMLRNPVSPGMGQHNFMQPGPSGPAFHGGPHPPPPFHGNVPPYQQNGFPMGHHGPYQGPWPGHGAGAPGMFQPPPHMMGYGAPGSMNWHGSPGHGYPGPMGPYPGPNQAGGAQQEGKKKQKQPQPQNQPKQKQQQQQNQPKQKQQQPQQQNQPKQKQQNQQQQQQNQQKQKQQQPQQQNQPKQKQQNQQQQNQPKQKQVPNNLSSNQEVGKKKKNAQEQNKNGAQPKITVPVGSCVTLSPNSPPSQQNGTAENSSTSNGGINLTQEEINKLKQSIQLMNAAAAATGKTKKKNRKKKKGGEEGGNGEEDDSGSGGEAEKRFVHLGPVKNQLGGEGAKKKQNVEQQKKEGGGEAQQAAAPVEGKKKKKKNAAGEASSDFSLYVGDRWPTLADIEAGRLKLDQPVKNILMVAKTPKGDICSTPKIIQDMLVFNKLHPTAALVFSSD